MASVFSKLLIDKTVVTVSTGSIFRRECYVEQVRIGDSYDMY